MGDRRRRFARLPLGFLCASLLFGPACGLSLPKSDQVEVSVDSEQITEILRAVFPNLTDDELHEYAANLDLKAVLELEAELREIRDVAEGLSEELTELADTGSEQRQTNLGMRNDGFPTELEPLGPGVRRLHRRAVPCG